MNEERTVNTLAKEADMLGYGRASSHIWEACCMRFGVGGTPEANGAYEQIMKVFLDELKTNLENKHMNTPEKRAQR